MDSALASLASVPYRSALSRAVSRPQPGRVDTGNDTLERGIELGRGAVAADPVERRGPLEYKYSAYAAWGLEAPSSASFEDFARDRFIIGDKVSVKDEIARYRELLGVDHFIMRCQWPGLPQERVLSSIQRLGEIFASMG